MSAKEMVDSYGELLLGAFVLTAPMGAYPGGWAMVVELRPDPKAPEIVMQVQSLFGQIGVFEDELIQMAS